MASGIEGKFVTEAMVEASMREAFPQHGDLKLEKLLSSKIIGVGKGFVSDVIRIEMEWSGGADVPKSLILKVPTVQKIGEIMDKIYKASEVSETSVGFILMEDLSGDFSLVDINNGLDRNQLEQIVDALSEFTIWSVKNRDSWDGVVPDFPEEMMATMDLMMETGVKRMEEMAPGYYGDRLKNLLPHVSLAKLKETRELMVAKYHQPNVLSHGDFHSNNLVFSEDGTWLRAIIDWQASRPNGAMAEDLWRMVCLSVDTKLRRELTPHLLRRYYDTVTEAFPGMFTYEELLKGWNLTAPFAVLGMGMALPGLIDTDFVEGDKEAVKALLLQRCRDAVDDALAGLQE